MCRQIFDVFLLWSDERWLLERIVEVGSRRLVAAGNLSIEKFRANQDSASSDLAGVDNGDSGAESENGVGK